MVLNSERSEEPVDILATNIRGMGAVRLVESLLPSLERVGGERIGRVWLPDGGPLAEYGGDGSDGRYFRYRRRLPNAVSRILECMMFSSRLGHGRSVLTLGDLPIRVARKQVVFVQNSFILGGSSGASLLSRLKGAAIRAVFKANLKSVNAIIVQTEAMRSQLAEAYPALHGRIHIVAQPAPQWLLDLTDRPSRPTEERIRLFYPAAGYPHKNHALLRDFARVAESHNPVESISLTIEAGAADSQSGLLRHLGSLTPTEMIEQYSRCDALVFPSLDESYGLPLVEAMFLGLPVIAADLPYAHALCGDGAIYFNQNSVASLTAAIDQLAARRSSGWTPDWSAQLSNIPRDWDAVARKMLAILDAAAQQAPAALNFPAVVE